ncbi:MAG TPA: aldo/keto reductase, partial [Baekduia sp.]|nr:aldo/keto reductase [Baekduia sp.]
TVDLPDTDLAPRLLDRYAAAGGRALDVANVYRDGESARAVGRWLRARPDAQAIMYAKGCHPPLCRPDLVAAEVDAARALLGVERIDVFILHRDDLSYEVAAWAEALLQQVDRGAIGAFGVSNWTIARLRELRAHLDAIGADHLDVLSNHFSLAQMVSPPWEGCLALSKDDLRAAGDLGVRVLAWSSLATGFFAGHDTPHWDSPANRARRDRAAELAERLGTTTPAVALAYVLHQPDHVLPVVGTRSEDHLEEALAARAIRLEPADLAWLESGVDPV